MNLGIWYISRAATVVYLQSLFIVLVVEIPIWFFLRILFQYGYISQDAEDLIAPSLAFKAICGTALLITVAVLVSYFVQIRKRFDKFLFLRRQTRKFQVSYSPTKAELTDALIKIGCSASSIEVEESNTRAMTVSAFSNHQKRKPLFVNEATFEPPATRWFRPRNFLVTVTILNPTTEIKIECWPRVWFEYLDMTETSFLMLEEFTSKYPARKTG